VHFGELSEFQLDPPAPAGERPTLQLLRGLLYFFGRDRPARVDIKTPISSTAVRGTEFNLAVGIDGRTVLTLVEGEAEFRTVAGRVVLTSGQQAVAEVGRPPEVTTGILTVNVIQWRLYYPAVLDLGELGLTAGERADLAATLEAYAAGDLRQALALYPGGRVPRSAAERVYLAAVLLAAGQVEKSEVLLAEVEGGAATDGGAPTARLAFGALRRLIAAVKNQARESGAPPELATEWLAASYTTQSRANDRQALAQALAQARQAVARSAEFAFGWARVAELEFSHGRRGAAREALERSLELAPRNAKGLTLKGYLLAAENRVREAREAFEQAIGLDGALGEAWLGRGLCRIREGRGRSGRADLLVAAALEPQRALLRSYLGKAFSEAGYATRAEAELGLARRLDAQDPTAWLYSALHLQQGSRINEAIRDLERSQALNDQRRLYRSRLLLDQDRAVRSANLARLYQEAGMDDVAVREAVRAVNADYANYSAHLFLANSYQAQSDPNLFNLRYETPAQSEYLLANLLAPPDAGTLSAAVSQQEYAKLFARDRLGVFSLTEYLSRGAWTQTGAQYGQLGGSSYSVDAFYRSDPGQGPNQDSEQRVLSLSLKQQVTPADTAFVQVTHYAGEGGDVAQRYDPAVGGLDYRYEEGLEPLLHAGYHHAWGSSAHTLFLASAAVSRLSLTNTAQPSLLAFRPGGSWAALFEIGLGERLQVDPSIYTVELQQLFTGPRSSTIVGGRFQYGDFQVRNYQDNAPAIYGPVFDPAAPVADESYSRLFRRWSVYGYQSYRIVEPLQLIAGVSYDRLTYPENFLYAPVSGAAATRDQVSPKAGVIWTPTGRTTVRGAYTRSLGGSDLDRSLQLEPSQVAGFVQSYRSLISESVLGAQAGPEFETFGLALEQKLGSSTYVGAGGEALYSEVERALGGFDAIPPAPALWAAPFQMRQTADYRERSVTVFAHQLLGDVVALGARYRLTQSELATSLPEVPDTVFTGAYQPQRALESVLHQVSLQTTLNHRAGWFARGQAVWNRQSNQGDLSLQAGDDFWQFNLLAGYRFARRQAEVALGVLNFFDQDYRLSPLTPYADLPRERTLVVRLRLNF